MNGVACEELTEAQKRVLRAIYRHVRNNGAYPTYRDLMDLLDFKSPNGVQHHIQRLKRGGWIACEHPEGARGRAVNIRLLGLWMEPRFADNENGRRLARVVLEAVSGED